MGGAAQRGNVGLSTDNWEVMYCPSHFRPRVILSLVLC